MAQFDLPLAELERYRPDVEEPADFDDFWGSTLAEARRHPAILDVRPEPSPLSLVRTWDVRFAGFAGDPVAAWYIRPAAAAGPLPVVVEYLGYGRGRGLPGERLIWPVAGFAHLIVDSRGQGDQWGCGGDTPDPHAGSPGGPGPVTWGIGSPHTYYYRRLITDAVRAVDAARHLDGTDPDQIVAAGNSQGGGLALAAAGLHPGLAAVLASAPFLCHLGRAINLTDQSPYGEIARYLAVHRGAEDSVRRTLSYVDGVNFARRAGAPVHVGVGLRDTTCPSSTVFAAYNHYGTRRPDGPRPQRRIEVYPFNGHEGGEIVHQHRQLQWLATVLDTSRSDPPRTGVVPLETAPLETAPPEMAASEVTASEVTVSEVTA